MKKLLYSALICYLMSKSIMASPFGERIGSLAIEMALKALGNTPKSVQNLVTERLKNLHKKMIESALKNEIEEKKKKANSLTKL